MTYSRAEMPFSVASIVGEAGRFHDGESNKHQTEIKQMKSVHAAAA
jgi:hypothetical protein